jgi:hypothetical protein
MDTNAFASSAEDLDTQMLLVGAALVATGVALLITAGIAWRQERTIQKLSKDVKNLTTAAEYNLRSIDILKQRTES